MSSGGVFDLTGLRKRHEDLESEMARPDLWDDREKAEGVARDKSALEAEIQLYDRLEEVISEAALLLELANEADEAVLLSWSASRIRSARNSR